MSSIEEKPSMAQPARPGQPSYDIVTLGETMLRLTPPGLKRMEQATSLELEVGGSESNTAVGLARLGLRVAWLSRLTGNPLGRLIESRLAGYGVDTSWVVWTAEDRIGLYFLEEGKPPRPSTVTYDRAGSAASKMQPTDLPDELFGAGQARLLHLTGITPALGPAAESTARAALQKARAAGWLVSFDLNYRARLWTPAQAADGCHPFAAAADLLIAPVDDARLLYRLDQTTLPDEVMRHLAASYPQATVVLTLGQEGAIGLDQASTAIERQPIFAAEEVGRIGGGDAFAAGLLYGFLQPANNAGLNRLAWALRWGAAVAALKYSTPGDMPVISRQEAEMLVKMTTPGPLKLSR